MWTIKITREIKDMKIYIFLKFYIQSTENTQSLQPRTRLLGKFHVMGFCRNYLATGFREDFPSVRLCGLKERKVMATVLS